MTETFKPRDVVTLNSAPGNAALVILRVEDDHAICQQDVGVYDDGKTVFKQTRQPLSNLIKVQQPEE